MRELIDLPERKRLLHRMYIDEVGNHDMKESLPESERYLTLFGAWISHEHVVNELRPSMDAIKQEFFPVDPDIPVIFHRKDITRFRGPFSRLYADADLRKAFGDRMLRAYREWEYVCAAVTIDKIEHRSRYKVWRHAPYHYCLEVLVERFVLYLYYRDLRGDVMIESRNPTLDAKLKESYRRLFESGTSNLTAELLQAHLTSREIKLKKKSANIAGLQLADLLAHPAFYDVLVEFGVIPEQESEYSRAVAAILNESKYNRDIRTGKIVGYGKKLLP